MLCPLSEQVKEPFTMVDGTCQVVQWLRLHASTDRGSGSIPGWGTKFPQIKKNYSKWVNMKDWTPV